MITVKKVGRYGVFESDIPKKLESALFNRLAYQRQGAEFMPNKAWSWVRFYNKKKRYFPWGLKNRVLEILKQWKECNGDEFELKEEKKLVWKAHYRTTDRLREYQRDAIEALIINEGGILSMATGSGKTRTAIEFLKNIKFTNGLIIVHTIDLKNQWEEKIFRNGLSSNIEVATYQSIKPERYKQIGKYDIVIYDECHHVAAKSLYNLAMRNGNAILIGLSATPYRADGEDMRIEAALGPIIYKIGTRELINQKYLCDAEVRIIKLKQKPAIDYFDDYNDIVNKWIVENDERNTVISNLAIEQSKNGLVLILVDKIEHGKILMDSPLKHYNAIFVHGSSKNRKKIFENVKAGKYDIVISSKIYGEGVDIPNLKTLILAGGGKSSVKVVQQVGRLLRLFPGKDKAIIYDFQDSARYLKNHFQARLEIYKNLFEVNFI